MLVGYVPGIADHANPLIYSRGSRLMAPLAILRRCVELIPEDDSI